MKIHKLSLLIPACFIVALANDSQALGQNEAPGKKWALVLHGGAGPAPDKLSPVAKAKRVKAMLAALGVGRNLLATGGASLDAAEQVIRFLEDDPQFNAGKGAVFNAAGGHQLDASIMDGRNKACGAVASVTTVKNPISLARKVMSETRHVLLAGEGADQFARELGWEPVAADYFWTPKLRRQYQQRKTQKSSGLPPIRHPYLGTVGCVALDQHGNLAAGTSTGGLVMKKFGRIGDSPIVGAGTYADNLTCAVSCTGIGEEYIRHAIAYGISARMALKSESVSQAVSHAIGKTLKPGDGGIIAVSHNGEIAIGHNTPGLSFGAADSAGRFEAGLEPK